MGFQKGKNEAHSHPPLSQSLDVGHECADNTTDLESDQSPFEM